MKNKRSKIVILFSIVIFLLFTGLGCKENSDQANQNGSSKGEKIVLEWWRLWDSQDTFELPIKEFEKVYPNIKINYRKLTYAEYEKEVVSALAAGKGPDIWSIHNTWLPKHVEKLSPMPESVMNPDVYKEIFVDVATNDLQGSDGNIYGIPFSVDTLALYYNKDYFNTAGITLPPETWTDFKEDVKKITKVDDFGSVELSGAAIGTSKNVSRAVDILYLLMMQNGTSMTNDARTKVTFDNKAITSSGETYSPGIDALIFYTDFANPKKNVYTWNTAMPNSTDAFVYEKAAMILGYSYQDAVIKSKAPKLNYDVTFVPQIEGSSKQVNFANYWAEVVSNTSQHQEEAWKFLAYLAKEENVENYCNITKLPASRKDVIEKQLDDPILKIFSKQALTARSWYQINSSAIENIFTNLIESVALSEKDPEEGIDNAVDQINSVMNIK